MPHDTSKKRIFVQMVSYRDPECHPTLRDLFEKAAHPERISVGLCWQYDPEEDMGCFAEEYPRADQVKVLQYHIGDAAGAGWARQQAQSLWAGEEYTLQVQAHMRFVKGWDEILINMLEGLPLHKAVLTGWPPHYTPPNKLEELQGMLPITGVSMLGREHDAQIVHLIRRYLTLEEVPDKPMLTASWVGNFMFAHSDVFKKVPFDPFIYFWGEELNYSARLWTHGYDIYHSNRVVLYHYWNRKDHAKDAGKYRDHQFPHNRLSLMRNRHVLGLGSATDPEALIDIEKYSIGTERTLTDYFRFYGIDLIQRTITPYAKMGLWHDANVTRHNRQQGRAPGIFVAIASYRDPELTPTLKDMFAKAGNPGRIRVGICVQRDKETDEDCGIESDRIDQISVIEMHYKHSKGANWARAQAMSMRQDEDYVLIIDSHMRFEAGWDNALIDMLSRCPSEKPAISGYLPNYNPPDERLQHPGQIMRVRVRRLGDGEDPQLVHVTGVFVDLSERIRAELYPCPFIIGNFIFGYQSMFDDIPIDPYFQFYGDETSYAARLWTHGYDIFQPDSVVMYHYWVRGEHLYLQHYRRTDTEKSHLSWVRGQHLIGLQETADKKALKDIEKYGLGDRRALEDLWKFAGIDWENRHVTQQAKEGWWDMSEYENTTAHKKGRKARATKHKKAPAKRTVKTSDKKMLPTLFVQIPSYRDPDCQHTVQDLFEKAAHPERIHVGICWQFKKDEDAHCFAIPYPRPKQVRVIEVDAKDSQGVCWARHQLQKLYQGEDFTLQIDSHMRFAENWDETLIAMWNDCDNKKTVLSCYPPRFTPPDKLQNRVIHGMAAERFNENGILLMKGRPNYSVESLPEKPIKGAFIGGCMLFGPASIIADVPYDPHLYFFGEEISLAVRLWTNGYDIYHPNKPVVYHDWDRGNRPTHFSDHADWAKPNEKSFARVRHLLGMETSHDTAVTDELDLYGLGNSRSLQQYEEFSGVDFSTRTFTQDAYEGVFGKNKKKSPRPLNVIVKKGSGTKPKIFVQIASYRDRECQHTIKDLFEKSNDPDRLSVGVCWQFDSEQDADCFQVSTRPEQVQMLPYDWREGEGVCWARNHTQSLWNGEEYTLQIDSHMRFVQGWDDLMIKELAVCASDKPLLSCSPASYTPPNNLQANPKPTIRRVLPFFQDGNLRGRGEYIDREPEKPLNGAFLAAGFMFARSEVIEEVPYDPYMYFDQEEISYAARLFTHGWDIFSSRKPLLYHYYNSDKGSVRPLHWQDLHKEDDKRIAFLRKRGLDRFNHLVGYKWTNDRDTIKDLVHYGFGTKRSLKEYEEYSGIDFKKKIASERALRCQFIKDLDKYRDAPIYVPELDGEKSPQVHMQKNTVKLNDNSEKEPPITKEDDAALNTLDPRVRLARTFDGKLPLMGPGDFAPFFITYDDQNQKRAIEVLAGRPVMMIFFPSGNKDYAQRLFRAVNQQMQPHGKLEAWQVFITDTTAEQLPAFKKDVFINAPLWADPDRSIANAFGVADLKNKRIATAGFLLNRNLKIIGRHVNLGPEQLAAAMVNECANLVASEKQKFSNPQIITETAPVLIVPDALSPDFCDHCIHMFRTGHTFEGTVGAEERAALRRDAKVRRDYVVHGRLLDEIDDRLSRTLFPEISKVFGFDVSYRELYKIGLYSGESQGFFRQHRDNYDAPLGYRRIAMTLHLSDDYEGGGLRFPEYGDHIYRPRKGAAIAFSAATMHEALPVTGGERFVVVGFFHGDQDEAYRRQYQKSKNAPLKIKEYAPLLRQYDGVTLSRNFYSSWKDGNVLYDGKALPSSAKTIAKPFLINTASGHQPKKVFESEQVIIMDDFLPQDIYEKLHQYVLKTDYEYINMQGKISRAWHIHDGFPLRSKQNAFYYAKDHPNVPKADYVYPTKRDLDLFIDGLIGVQPHVEHLIGKQSKDWWHVSATCWIYPPKTGLSLHDDGSGVYSGAYTYFLNPTWRPHWGGILVMMDEEANRRIYEMRESGDEKDFFKLKYFHANDMDEEIMKQGLGKAILPKANRIVFIANDAYHMITRVNETAGDNLRMSIAGFYNRKQK